MPISPPRHTSAKPVASPANQRVPSGDQRTYCNNPYHATATTTTCVSTRASTMPVTAAAPPFTCPSMTQSLATASIRIKPQSTPFHATAAPAGGLSTGTLPRRARSDATPMTPINAAMPKPKTGGASHPSQPASPQTNRSSPRQRPPWRRCHQ